MKFKTDIINNQRMISSPELSRLINKRPGPINRLLTRIAERNTDDLTCAVLLAALGEWGDDLASEVQHECAA